LIQSSLTNNTHRTYAAGAKSYADFCETFTGKFAIEQPSVNSVSKWLTYLADPEFKGLSYKTITTYMAGLTSKLQLASQDVSMFKDPRIKSILEGIAHTGGLAPRITRLPLTEDLLQRMVTLINSRGPVSSEHRLTFAAMAAGIYGLMRGGEFLLTTDHQREESLLNLNQLKIWEQDTYATGSKHRPKRTLVETPISTLKTRCTGTTPWSYPEALSVTLICSKNDPRKRGTEAIIGNATGIQLICDYLIHSHPSIDNKDSGLFLNANGSRLTSAQLLPKMRELLAMINIPNPEVYMLHSLRKGGAQSLRDAGTSEEQIRLQGRWKTQSAASLYSTQSIQQSIAISKRK
jgi:hypothetical protein